MFNVNIESQVETNILNLNDTTKIVTYLGY